MDKLIIGCGYLGRLVAARWQRQGHTVYGFTRNRETELAALGIRPIRGDVREPLDVIGLSPAETVLYAVAPGRQAGQAPDEIWIIGLIHITTALGEWPTRPRFIFISSTSVYGQTDGEEVDENATTQPAEEAGRILVRAEQALRTDWWPDAIVLRFGAIYGPGRLPRSKSILAGEPIIGDPDKWLNLIHVEDGADAVLAAETRSTPGQLYNVCDGHPVRRRDFYTAMAQVLHAPPPRFELTPPNAALPHETANRRISNRRMREGLRVELRYPSYVSGL